MKQRLALGHQEFSEVIKNNCIYVDKTQDIYNLIYAGKYYFLSRPRRFGKSLLANTIKELFAGEKDLFKGLWIYDKWNWEEKYPVIKISFANIDYDTEGLQKAISTELKNIADQYQITLVNQTNALKFKELIYKFSENKQVAVVIDEYDKPIIDYMDNIPKAEENRKILKKFYSIIKDADKHLRFLFITGVSKFSHVSIFSDLNNLSDITVDSRFSTITGFTKTELENYFGDYLEELRLKFTNIPDIMQALKTWYNGYSWNGIDKVYNPVSIMNCLQKQRFSNYWFSTGTPTMLINIIKDQKLTGFDIEDAYSSEDILNKYDFRHIKLSSLLFQTGYLTIGYLNENNGFIELVYPNKEVEQSFSRNILAELTDTYEDRAFSLFVKILRCLTENNLSEFINKINELFKNIPYSIVENTERYFHSLFYLVMKLIGFEIETEILTIDGRIDAVVKTENYVYVIEFKINQSASDAIKQIENKKYADKYKSEGKTIKLLGINFDTEKKKIDDYVVV